MVLMMPCQQSAKISVVTVREEAWQLAVASNGNVQNDFEL